MKRSFISLGTYDPTRTKQVRDARPPTLSHKPRKDGAPSGPEIEAQFEAGDAVSIPDDGLTASEATWVDSGR
jgi:hypothetical protein